MLKGEYILKSEWCGLTRVVTDADGPRALIDHPSSVFKFNVSAMTFISLFSLFAQDY